VKGEHRFRVKALRFLLLLKKHNRAGLAVERILNA
jgi:hypothetical protein